MNAKEMHFYAYDDKEVKDMLHSFNDTEQALLHNKECIHTTQMWFMNGGLFEDGYKIFVHESKDDMYEIKLGSYNERTNREIRLAHNLVKMWVAGEFTGGGFR